MFELIGPFDENVCGKDRCLGNEKFLIPILFLFDDGIRVGIFCMENLPFMVVFQRIVRLIIHKNYYNVQSHIVYDNF